MSSSIVDMSNHFRGLAQVVLENVCTETYSEHLNGLGPALHLHQTFAKSIRPLVSKYVRYLTTLNGPDGLVDELSRLASLLHLMTESILTPCYEDPANCALDGLQYARERLRHTNAEEFWDILKQDMYADEPEPHMFRGYRQDWDGQCYNDRSPYQMARRSAVDMRNLLCSIEDKLCNMLVVDCLSDVEPLSWVDEHKEQGNGKETETNSEYNSDEESSEEEDDDDKVEGTAMAVVSKMPIELPNTAKEINSVKVSRRLPPTPLARELPRKHQVCTAQFAAFQRSVHTSQLTRPAGRLGGWALDLARILYR
jgi:hypothetical protein